jgi:hypothetical protein
MARDICARNYNKPFLGAFVLVFLVSLVFQLRYGQLKEYASAISIPVNAPAKKPEQLTSTRDSAATSQNGNKDTNLVKTSRQCSSVLNLIYSGANVSLDRADAGGSNDIQDTTHSLVDSRLPSIHDLWQNKIHPRLLSHILDWTFSPLGFGYMPFRRHTMSSYFPIYASRSSTPCKRRKCTRCFGLSSYD